MKNQGGFTLLEVLLSLVILATSVSILSSLQLRSLMRMWRSREEIERVFLVRKDLTDIFLKLPEKDKPIINKIEDPLINITTQAEDINKKSGLAPFMETIKIVRSDAEWKSNLVDRKLSMISFILKTEEKEQ